MKPHWKYSFHERKSIYLKYCKADTIDDVYISSLIKLETLAKLFIYQTHAIVFLQYDILQ